MAQNFQNPLKLSDLKPDLLITFDWSDDLTSELAKQRKLRPLAKVITKDHLPTMDSGVGIQLIDDPSWVMNAELAIEKGKKFYPRCRKIPSQRSEI